MNKIDSHSHLDISSNHFSLCLQKKENKVLCYDLSEEFAHIRKPQSGFIALHGRENYILSSTDSQGTCEASAIVDRNRNACNMVRIGSYSNMVLLSFLTDNIPSSIVKKNELRDFKIIIP